jgi:hypothetical protein
VKSLRASASVLNRTAEQDAAWVRQVEAAKGRLRQQQEASAAAGPDAVVERSDPARAVAPGSVEAEPRPLPTAEATVEAETGEAPAGGVERAGADVTMEEVTSAPGQGVAPARGSLPQQDLPA